MFQLQQIEVEITGIQPLMLSNGASADPDSDIAKALKAAQLAKKQSADEQKKKDALRLAWESCLYLDDDERPCIPGVNIEASIRDGAKKTQGIRGLGNLIISGCWCEGLWPIIHEGPPDLDTLYADRRFVDIRTAVNKNTKQRIVVCRPRFDVWKLRFTLAYNADTLSESLIFRALYNAGMMCGIGNYRPRFGLFTISKFPEIDGHADELKMPVTKGKKAKAA